MLRRFVLPLLACAVLLGAAAPAPSPLPTVAPGGRAPYVAVLVWHDVLPRKQVWFDTTTATLAAQLDAIARGGFHVVTLQALREHLEHGAPLPAKPLVLTFDDNGCGIFRYAYPMLRQHRFPATLFVHTNYVGVTTSKCHNTWAQLAAMQHGGLVTIESLTANHPEDLRSLSDAGVLHEFTLSRFSLTRRLGRVPFAVVYPYDNYDQRVARLAHEAGYELGFTEDWGDAGASENLLTIHRYSILTRFAQALHDVATASSR